MIKTTGAEFKKFYNDKVYWKNSTWHTDGEFAVEGEYVDEDYDLNSFKDTDRITIYGGIVYFAEEEDESKSIEFEKYFRKWKKEQTEELVLVQIQKEDVDKLKTVLKQFKKAKIL